MALIYAGSTDLLSSHRTSRFIGPVLRWFVPHATDETVRRVQIAVRKTGHFTEYAILSVLLCRALRPRLPDGTRPWSWRAAGGAVVLSALYAVSDEYHQSHVASRYGSGWDVLIDTLGAGAGVLIYHRFQRRRARR